MLPNYLILCTIYYLVKISDTERTWLTSPQTLNGSSSQPNDVTDHHSRWCRAEITWQIDSFCYLQPWFLWIAQGSYLMHCRRFINNSMMLKKKEQWGSFTKMACKMFPFYFSLTEEVALIFRCAHFKGTCSTKFNAMPAHTEMEGTFSLESQHPAVFLRHGFLDQTRD